MRHDTHSAPGAMNPPRSTTGSTRWLILAVALCGALAGGSIVEAIAAFASHASMPVSPDHLIAEPLAVAGALCGGLLAALLVSKEQRGDHSLPETGSAQDTALDVSPGEPMTWLPAPHVVTCTPPSTTTHTPISRTPRLTPRMRHIRASHVTRYRTVRETLSRPRVEH